MDYCISRLHLPLHLSLIHYCTEDTNCRVRSHEMEDKQSRMSNDATVGKKSIRALEIFRVQKLILNATS